MSTNGNLRPSPTVVIYTTPQCSWCKVAKRYFAEHNIEYREVDVQKDRRAAREMVLMTGGNVVPVIRVGSHAMTGWNVHEFERLFGGKFKHR